MSDKQNSYLPDCESTFWDNLPSQSEIEYFFDHISLPPEMSIEYSFNGIGIEFTLNLDSVDCHRVTIITWSELENLRVSWQDIISIYIKDSARLVSEFHFLNHFKVRKLNPVKDK